jgi:protein phosphatase
MEKMPGAGDIRWGSRTDPGRKREHNEDAVLVAPPVFLVADGMGGHAAGDVASRLALAAFEEIDPAVQLRDLVFAARQANDLIRAHAEANPARRGMGTTLSGFAIIDGRAGTYAAVVNVGDSRTYLARQDRLEQITVDHSLVQELVDAGEITEDEAQVHPHRNVVTRALGIDLELEVDTATVPLQSGDRLLVCSDGLTGVVPLDTIATVLAQPIDAVTTADRLVHLALEAGAPDNVSVIVVDVGTVETPTDVDDDIDTIPGSKLPTRG